MIQKENKELLLKDLCARLPYGVIVETPKGGGRVCDINLTIFGNEVGVNINPTSRDKFNVEECKPYLFPISSMTEEQRRELLTLAGYEERCEESCGFDSWGFYVNIVGEYKYEDNQESTILYPNDIGIDWLNKNHFDYNGLIDKGLALDATNLNIY